MAPGRSLRGDAAEHIAAGRVASNRDRRPRPILRLAAVAVLAMLGMAARASALTITGGPVYALPGGGSCSVSGTAASQSGGATWTCTGVNTAAHTHVYFGMRVDTNANGNTMTGVSPSGGNDFTSVTGTTSSTITYDNSTTTVADQIHGTQTVTNQLILSTGGTNPGTVVATGGTPAGNANGSITDLFSLPTGLVGASFTVNAQINASTPFVANGAALTTYTNSHPPSSGTSDFSKVDLAFYFSDCGDGVVDSPEQCDQGSGVNGTPGSCCSATCTLLSSATVCRGVAGGCDVAENCTGSSPTCPGDVFQPSGAVCRPSAGGCDIAETCSGSSAACPADSFQSSGTVCRSAAGVCDAQETCPGGSPSCPADAFQPSTVVCRLSAGVCDQAENCTGSSAACPSDSFKS